RRRGSEAPSARATSHTAMTAVFPRPVGMSREETSSPWRKRRSSSTCHGNGACGASRPSAPRSQSTASGSPVLAAEASTSLLTTATPVPTARLRVDPLVELGALDAPLAPYLESRNLAGLRHGVDGLLRELEQRG